MADIIDNQMEAALEAFANPSPLTTALSALATATLVVRGLTGLLEVDPADAKMRITVSNDEGQLSEKVVSIEELLTKWDELTSTPPGVWEQSPVNYEERP